MGDSLLHCSHDEDVTEDDSSEAGDAEDNMETGDEVERSEDETQQTEEGKKQSEDEAQQAQKGKELLADTSEMTAEQKGSQRELTKLLSEKAKMKAGLAQLNKLIHENKQASQELRKRKRNEDHSSEAEACDNTETGDEHSGCQEKRSKISPTSPDVSTDVEIIGCETTPKVGTLKTGHGNSSVEDGPMDLSQKAAQSDSVSEEEVAAQVGSVDLSQRPALSDAVSKEEATLLRDFDYLVSAFPNIKREQMQIMLRQHKNDANRVDTITDIVLNRKSPDPTSRPTEGLQKCASTVLPGSASGASVSLPSTSGTQHHSEARGDRVVAARTSLVAGPSSALEAAASGASGASHGLKQPNDSIEDLWNDTRAVVDGVKSVQPDAAVDVGVLVELCRKHSGPGRIPRVIDELLSRVQKQRELRKAEKPQYVTESPVEVKANDSLYKDLHTLMGMFPARNQDEMYAYLEVHRDRADRVERVVEELVGTASDVEELNAGSEMMPKNLWKKPTLLEELKMLTEMFPACDPSFLENSLQAKSQDPERVQTIATELSNGKPYPKLKDKIARERKEAARRRLWNLDLNVDDFLDKFPDPVKAFNNTEKPMGASYREHCFVKLRNEFPRLRSGFIRNVMEKFKHHLTPSWEELLIKANFAENRFSKKFRSGPLRDHMPYPQEPDEVFFHEVWFFEHQQEVLACLEEKKQMRLSKVNEAKANNELCTCQICFDDEILLEEMQHCDDGHMYCQDCISRYAQTRIAEALFTFPCLEESCKSKFPLEVLKKVLPPNTLSILLVRLVEQSVKEAGIPDLVTCPFCPFATIMPNPDDKVFKCQNPDCLKESCRLCHEPNHIPFRCNEVEKSGEVAMRTFIENRISEAMLRTCPTCKRRFFKEHGCNKMKCHCGTTMCYVCREPNIDYQHFQDGRCKLDSFGEDKLHKEEMEKAAEEARKEYLEQHPEAEGLTLKYDPDNHLKEFREMMMKKKHRRPGWGLLLGQMPQDDSDSESEEDESLTTSDSDDSDGYELIVRRGRNNVPALPRQVGFEPAATNLRPPRDVQPQPTATLFSLPPLGVQPSAPIFPLTQMGVSFPLFPPPLPMFPPLPPVDLSLLPLPPPPLFHPAGADLSHSLFQPSSAEYPGQLPQPNFPKPSWQPPPCTCFRLRAQQRHPEAPYSLHGGDEEGEAFPNPGQLPQPNFPQPSWQPPPHTCTRLGVRQRQIEAPYSLHGGDEEGEAFPNQRNPPPAHSNWRSEPAGPMRRAWKPNYQPPSPYGGPFLPRARFPPAGETRCFRDSPPAQPIRNAPSINLSTMMRQPRLPATGTRLTRDPFPLPLLHGELTWNEGSRSLLSDHGETSHTRGLTRPLRPRRRFLQDDESSVTDLPIIPQAGTRVEWRHTTNPPLFPPRKESLQNKESRSPLTKSGETSHSRSLPPPQGQLVPAFPQNSSGETSHNRNLPRFWTVRNPTQARDSESPEGNNRPGLRRWLRTSGLRTTNPDDFYSPDSNLSELSMHVNPPTPHAPHAPNHADGSMQAESDFMLIGNDEDLSDNTVANFSFSDVDE